jgi:FdhE protein
MHILEPEGQSAIRLDVCDECHAYLKTYNEEGDEGIYLQDWATLHFDMLCEEQNFIKKGSVLLESK